MPTGAGGRVLTLVCLAIMGCADESGAARSSWDSRPVASTPAAREPMARSPATALSEESVASTPPPRSLLPAAQVDRGPLPIDGRALPPSASPRDPFAPPAVLNVAPSAAASMCRAYGNEAAAILAAQSFPVESARMTGGYQVSDGGTMVSFWRNTPLVVLGLQGRPVYCVAERQKGAYRVPAGRRVCFADPDGDFLFDRVFIVQAEPKSYGTAPVRYELNPLEAARRLSPECYVPG